MEAQTAQKSWSQASKMLSGWGEEAAGRRKVMDHKMVARVKGMTFFSVSFQISRYLEAARTCPQADLTYAASPAASTCAWRSEPPCPPRSRSAGPRSGDVISAFVAELVIPWRCTSGPRSSRTSAGGCDPDPPQPPAVIKPKVK